MFFLIDAQLPPGLGEFFTEAGHRADHVNSVGLGNASDYEIFDFALREGAVIVTKDADFIAMAERQPLAAVIWVRIGNTTNRALRVSFSRFFDEVLQALKAGDRIVIIE